MHKERVIEVLDGRYVRLAEECGGRLTNPLHSTKPFLFPEEYEPIFASMALQLEEVKDRFGPTGQDGIERIQSLMLDYAKHGWCGGRER